MLVELVLYRRIAHPLCILARVLRGKIEHEDDIVDLPYNLRLQTGDAGNQFGNIGVGGSRRALRS